MKLVAGTEDLSLSSSTIAVLTSGTLSFGWNDDWPTFPNLTDLHVSAYELSGWKVLPNILKSTPYLEELKLDRDLQKFRVKGDFSWVAPDSVPKCLLENLEVVEYEFFTGRKDEMDIVEYFLKEAHILDAMAIGIVVTNYSDELEKKTMAFPRCSETCQVLVHKTVDMWGKFFNGIYEEGSPSI